MLGDAVSADGAELVIWSLKKDDHGDGAALLNQWAAAFTNIPRSGRITPLDPVLTGAAARSSNAGRFGLRIGRRLSPRFTAELNVDYSPATLELLDTALGEIDATRTTFCKGLE